MLDDPKRFAEAEPLFRRALAIRERSLGVGHPDVAQTLDNLGQLLEDTNRLDEAETIMRRALAIREQSLGPDHPHVAITLNTLAVLLMHSNRQVEAESLFRRALNVWEKSLGKTHSNVGSVLNGLALLLHESNRLEEAEPLYRRALAISEQKHGADHPKVAAPLTNLAGLLEETNRLVEAEHLYRRALAIHEKSLAPDHPHTFDSMTRLADVLEKMGKEEDCERLREQFADRVLHTSAVAPLTRRQLALHFFRRRDYERAEQLLLQLLKVSFEPAGTRHHLARLCFITERYADAREHVTQGWAARANANFHIVARLLWFQLALEMLDENEKSEVRDQKLVLILGRLKAALQNDGAFMEWTMQPVLDHLQPKLSHANHSLLTALVAALSDHGKMSELDQFLEWRNATSQPLD